MTKTSIDKNLINTLAALLHENGLTEIEYDAGGVKVRVSSSNATVCPPSVVVNNSAVKEDCSVKDTGEAVKSPMVGVVYCAPEPDAAPYIKEGDTVKKGQTLFLIEAMKTFNAVRAPRAGVIKQILVKDSQPVEYDEPLVILE